jgi:hypothetical protein
VAVSQRTPSCKNWAWATSGMANVYVRRTSCVFAAPQTDDAVFCGLQIVWDVKRTSLPPGKVAVDCVARKWCHERRVRVHDGQPGTQRRCHMIHSPHRNDCKMWQVTNKFQPSTSVPSFCKTVWGIPRSLLWPSIPWQPARATPPKRGHTRVPKNEI